MDKSDGSGWLPLSRRSALGTLAGAVGIGTAGCLFDNDGESDGPDGGNESMSGEPPDTDHPIGDRQGIQAIDPVADRRRYRGYHVDHGCAVSVGSGDVETDDTLAVASGRYFVAGAPYDLASSVSVGITEQPSPGAARWDVVHGTDSGVEVTAGTEAVPRPSDAQRQGVERPAPPQVSGTVLAWIWVSSESGTVTDDDVIDRRLFGHSQPAKSAPYELVSQTPTGRERGEAALWGHNDSLTKTPPLEPGAWTVHDARLFPKRRQDERFGSRTTPRSLMRFGEGLYGLFCQSTPRAHEQNDDPDLANQTGSLLFSRDLVSWTEADANPVLAYNEEDWQGVRALGEALVWDDDREQWAAMMSATVGDDDSITGVRAVGVGFNDDLDAEGWQYPDENPVIDVDSFGDWIPDGSDRVYCRGLHKVRGEWIAFCTVGVASDPPVFANGILRSDDLLTWRESDDNPIFAPRHDWEGSQVQIDTPTRWNGRWYAPYRGEDWEKFGIAQADSLTGPWETSPEPVLDASNTHWDGFEGLHLVPFGGRWAMLLSVYEDEGRSHGDLGIAHTGLASDVLPAPARLDDTVTEYAFYDDFGDGTFDSGRIPTVGGVQAGLLRPEWATEIGAPSVTDGALVTDTDGGNTVVTAPSALRTGTWRATFSAGAEMTDAPVAFSPIVQERDQNEYRIQLSHQSDGSSTPSLRVTEYVGGTSTDVIESSWPRDTERHTVSLVRHPGGMLQLFFDGASQGTHSPDPADQDWVDNADHLLLLHAADSTAFHWDEIAAW